MKKNKFFLSLATATILLSCGSKSQTGDEENDWQMLFNGKDLEG